MGGYKMTDFILSFICSICVLFAVVFVTSPIKIKWYKDDKDINNVDITSGKDEYKKKNKK